MPNKNIKILSSEYSRFRPDIQEYFKTKVLKMPSVILDPMAGTAPFIPYIETHGHKAYLNDILPIHLHINRAKTYKVYKCYKEYGYDWFLQQMLHCMASLQGKRLCISDKWIDDSVLVSLTHSWHEAERYEENVVTLLKAAIVLCVRPLSSFTRTKNPTWFKTGGMSSGETLEKIIEESLTRFDRYYLHNYESKRISQNGECIITSQNASDLRLLQGVDLILTSPPYCNRLDPAVLYGPEHYFLSMVGYSIPGKSLIGMTKVSDYDTFDIDFESITKRSKVASHLLKTIKDSPPSDDPQYYLKYYTRYFAMVSQTILRVLDNLSSKGKMYAIFQDNTHRGNLIEIDRIVGELLTNAGWQSKLVKKWERAHLGLKNVSRRHAFVRPRQFEKLVVIWK